MSSSRASVTLWVLHWRIFQFLFVFCKMLKPSHQSFWSYLGNNFVREQNPFNFFQFLYILQDFHPRISQLFVHLNKISQWCGNLQNMISSSFQVFWLDWIIWTRIFETLHNSNNECWNLLLFYSPVKKKNIVHSNPYAPHHPIGMDPKRWAAAAAAAALFA